MKRATVDPQKCDPGACKGGVCLAKLRCPRKIIKQEEPYEIPFVYGNGDLCKGCFLCQEVCPAHAMIKV